LAQTEPEVVSSELTLALELVSFEHVYSAPDRAHLVARATYDGRDGRSYEREFETRRPAAAAVEARRQSCRARPTVFSTTYSRLRGAVPPPRA
jgi:hypothetical protein